MRRTACRNLSLKKSHTPSQGVFLPANPEPGGKKKGLRARLKKSPTEFLVEPSARMREGKPVGNVWRATE